MSGTPTRRYSAGPGARPGFHRQGTESPVGYGERIERIRRMSGSGNMLFPTGMGRKTVVTFDFIVKQHFQDLVACLQGLHPMVTQEEHHQELLPTPLCSALFLNIFHLQVQVPGLFPSICPLLDPGWATLPWPSPATASPDRGSYTELLQAQCHPWEGRILIDQEWIA